MKRMSAIFFLGYTLLGMIGCGDSSHNSSARAPENQAAVNDLQALMTAHPEIARSTLKEIKDSSQAMRVSSNVRYFTTKPTQQNHVVFSDIVDTEDNNVEPPIQENDVITQEIAQKAQELIDKALDDFDFMYQIDAEFKLTGIYFNEIKTQLEHYQELGKSHSLGNSKSDLFGDKMNGNLDKGNLFQDKQLPTCEEFVNNPYIRHSKEEISRMITLNKTSIKAKLSGCAQIRGAEFTQCLSDYNELYRLINEHATCDMKSRQAFLDTLNQKTEGNADKIAQHVQQCMSEHFKACGFVSEKPASQNDA